MIRRFAYLTVTLLLAGLGLLAIAGPALAHIVVTPDSAKPGSAAVLTFNVPNEEAGADTTKVDMRIPTDHPIAQLVVKPVPGWDVSVRTVTLAKPLVTDNGTFTHAVSEVIWSGGKIASGQFQEFTISADPLPQGVTQIAFKTLQTYSNGDVVRWIDVPRPGQPEPDHPAPMLSLSAPPAPAAAGGTAPTTSARSGSDGMARTLGIVGVTVGLLALAVGGLHRRRSAVPAALEPGGAAVGAGHAEPGNGHKTVDDRSARAPST